MIQQKFKLDSGRTIAAPRKILYVHYVPTVTGAAMSLGLLLRHLDRRRFEPHVLQVHPHNGPVSEYFSRVGVACHHVPTRLVWDQHWLSEDNLRSGAWRAFDSDPAIAKFLDKLKPDIVHVNDFPPVSAAITASHLGIPVVWHSRWVLSHTDSWGYPSRRVIETMERYADRLVAIAEPEARQFSRNETHTVFNPIDLEAVKFARSRKVDVRRELGVSPEAFLVVAPIPLTENKGAWDYIEACGWARQREPNRPMHFALVGSISSAGRRHALRKWTKILGPESERKQADLMIQKWNLQDVFSLTGHRNNIYDYIQASDLVVFPSHLKACGRPCFEAGAFGKAVIVTMPDKQTRVVVDEVTGLILPEREPKMLGEAIARLATNPQICERMGAAGKTHVARHFDARVHAAQIMEIYHSLLACAVKSRAVS